VNQVGVVPISQSQNERGNRLAQARFGRGVVVLHVKPLPFEHDMRADRVRIGSHQLGLDSPVSPQPNGQPVLAVAGILGDRWCVTTPENQNVRKRITDQIDGR
jgi:hypothetical protein